MKLLTLLVSAVLEQFDRVLDVLLSCSIVLSVAIGSGTVMASISIPTPEVVSASISIYIVPGNGARSETKVVLQGVNQ